MRLFFILSEDRFFKPQFLEKIIDKRKKDIIGIAVISGKHPKISFIKHIKRHLALFGHKAFFFISLKEIYFTFLDKINIFFPLRRSYSTKRVTLKYNIPLFTPKNVNEPEFLNTLKKLHPDIIISSSNQVFKKELLSIPKIACINRHTALLPQYGGIWPVFWAMLNDEKKIGVTISNMIEKIDEGSIITQGAINVNKNDAMYGIYEKAFNLSTELVLEAIDILEHGKKYKIINKNRKRTYFGFPKKVDAELFRKKRKRFI